MTFPYNIYYGTRCNCKYRFTKNFRNEQDALNFSENLANSYYYKNEGKQGIPKFNQLMHESQLTGIDIEQLYKDHIYDSMRWYVIPTEVDTISSKNIKY